MIKYLGLVSYIYWSKHRFIFENRHQLALLQMMWIWWRIRAWPQGLNAPGYYRHHHLLTKESARWYSGTLQGDLPILLTSKVCNPCCTLKECNRINTPRSGVTAQSKKARVFLEISLCSALVWWGWEGWAGIQEISEWSWTLIWYHHLFFTFNTHPTFVIVSIFLHLFQYLSSSSFHKKKILRMNPS